MALPSSYVGAEPPAGWGAGPTPTTEVHVDVHACQRISFGLFERGPVTHLVEVHGNRDPPESCRGDYTTSEVITQWWVDDLDLAEAYRAIGLPIAFANFSWMSDATGVVREFSVSFASDLGGGELAQVAQHGDQSSEHTVIRRFWENPWGGISYMDFDEEYWANLQDPSPVYGRLDEPFLYSNLAETYVAYGGFYDALDSKITIAHFEDMSCEQPYLPSS